MIGMEGAKVPLLKLPSPNNEGEFYVDDRVKYMDKRHVVVAVDLKWMAIEEAAGIYKTRRGLIAVREEIHAPFWRACYLHQEGDVIYIRPWAVRELNGQGPRRGVSFSWDNAPMHAYWCPRCAHLNMYGTILCNGCHLPIFYREWVPGTVRALVKHGQPIWLSELKAVRPSSWHEGETDAWAPLMASVNPIREVVSCMITGLRCAPHLVHIPNADIVQVAFQEVAKVTSKDTHACVRASDEALERWVAKQLLIEESNTGVSIPDNMSVFAYLIEHPQQAAQWGRHMTRKGSLNSAFALYLSVHIFDAYRIGIEDGYLVPLYGLGASRADIIMSLVQAERRLTDFTILKIRVSILLLFLIGVSTLCGPVVDPSRPQLSMLRHTFMSKTTKLTWSPLRGATANAPLFLLTRRLGSTTGGQPPLGETNDLLPRDLNPDQRVISKRAKPLRNPGPRAEVTRVTSSQERVTKLISTKARVANTATNKGSSVVADPPDRELPLAGISLMLAGRDTRVLRQLLTLSRVRCTPLSQWEGTCNSQWLAGCRKCGLAQCRRVGSRTCRVIPASSRIRTRRIPLPGVRMMSWPRPCLLLLGTGTSTRGGDGTAAGDIGDT